MMEGAKKLWGVFFIRSLTPIMRVEPSRPNRFPKAPPPSTITFGIRIPTYESGGTYWDRSNPPAILLQHWSIRVSLRHYLLKPICLCLLSLSFTRLRVTQEYGLFLVIFKPQYLTQNLGHNRYLNKCLVILNTVGIQCNEVKEEKNLVLISRNSCSQYQKKELIHLSSVQQI